jgi:hypothetical protein
MTTCEVCGERVPKRLCKLVDSLQGIPPTTLEMVWILTCWACEQGLPPAK